MPYLTLAGQKPGSKSYIAKPDANGKFSFKDVEKGAYTLKINGSKDYFTGAAKQHKDPMEVSSFSWGSKSLEVASSAGVRVAAADLNGDGTAERCANGQHIKSAIKVSFDNPTNEGDVYYKVVMQDIVISNIACPSGSITGFAIKEQGLK